MARLALRGDADAGRAFIGPKCGLCTDSQWELESKRLDATH
jgi:hypothetical protein